MAEYSTNTEELKGIANAIRTKGGTSATLEFPDEFKAAIEAIQTDTGTEEELNLVLDRHIVTLKSNAFDIGNYALRGCRHMTHLNLPKCERVWYSGIRENAELISVDLGSCKFLDSSALRDNTNLTTLIIRSPAVATMENVNALSQTPIESGTGYVYVPKALVEQYKAAPNWSTYAAQIRAIEDYPDITGGVV